MEWSHGGSGILGAVVIAVSGGAGGGRSTSGGEHSSKHHLKMSFPRFNGEQPKIWKDKCLDYFLLFNVHPSLWLVSCTLHMDGNAALWLKAYRLRHEITTCAPLKAARAERPHIARGQPNGPWPRYCFSSFFADFSFLFCLSEFE
jgi:hypothetical protein